MGQHHDKIQHCSPAKRAMTPTNRLCCWRKPLLYTRFTPARLVHCILTLECQWHCSAAYHLRVGISAADRQQDLSNGHAGTQALRLAKGTTHAGLEPISSSTRKHLVDTQDMEGVHPDSQMEGILSSVFDHVLVGSNTGCFQGF